MGSNDGTVTGATVAQGWEICPPKGNGEVEDSDVLSFDGINDYVSIPDSNSLDVGNLFTVSAWIKKSSNGFRGLIVDKFNGSISFGVENDDTVFIGKSNSR